MLSLIADGLPERTRHAQDGPVWQLAWSSDTTTTTSSSSPSSNNTARGHRRLHLATCAADRTVRIFPVVIHATSMGNTAAAPTSRKGVATTPGKATIGEALQTLGDDHHKRTIRAVSFSPWHAAAASSASMRLAGGAQLLACASFDATVSVWSRTSVHHDSGYSGNGYSGDSHSSDMDADLYAHAATLEGHENEVKSVAWSNTSPLLATCSRDKSVWIWECDEDGDFQCVAVLQDHTQDVKMVRWHPHRELLVSASYDNSIKVWLEHAGDEEWYCAQTLSSEGASSMPKGQQGDDESDSGVRKDAMYGHTSTVWAVDFSPCGRWLVSVGDDCAVKLWELVTTDGSIHDPVTASADGDHDIHGTSRQPRYIHRKTYPNHHQRPIYTVSWHATTSSSPTTTSTTTTTTNYIATAGGDHCIAVIIDPLTASERIVRVEGAHSSDVNCVAWAPTGAEVDTTTPVLASCSDDGAVKIWEVVNI